MIKNYIILAHKNPNQLLRLIDKLNDSYSRFYVHIDNKSDITLFNVLKERNCICLIHNRVNTIWGDFSTVQATINCISQIIYENRNGYTILLSGQDYPIANNQFINSYLERFADYDHIDVAPVKNIWPRDYYFRLYKYNINITSTKGGNIFVPYFFNLNFIDVLKIFCKLIKYSFSKNKINTNFPISNIFKKRTPKIENHFGGSQWWAFKFDTLKYIDSYIKDNDDFVTLHKYTHLADEIFFQTIIMILAKDNSTISIKPSLTYVNWTRKNCSLPVIFNQDDFDEIVTQTINNKLFARKFDYKYDSKILDMIDSHFA